MEEWQISQQIALHMEHHRANGSDPFEYLSLTSDEELHGRVPPIVEKFNVDSDLLF